MKLIVTKDYEAMSRVALEHVMGVIYDNDHRVNLAITGGRTPIRMYEMMVEEMKGSQDFKHVHYYNFDELPFRSKSREGVTISDLRKLFLTPTGVDESQIHKFTEENYQGYDALVKSQGGLDAILIGIGADGHFCGNMPGSTHFHEAITVVNFPDEMKENLLSIYPSIDEVPDFFVTFGPKMVMHARKIILIANGKEKAEILKTALYGPIAESIPSSILQLHPNLVVICDEEAASLLK